METAYVVHPLYLEHNRPGHPESARRLETILDALDERGLRERIQPLEPRPASEDEVLRVHEHRHVERVRQAAQSGPGYLDPDTYVSRRSYEAALMAAGGVIRAVEAILSGEIANAFALVRPPGHHATAGQAMGFCLFNNVAVATRAALAHKGTERVFIVDFDVHHGNGTANLFEAEPDVFYISTHQYPYYPGTGARDEVGLGPAKGTMLNVPLPAGVGDRGYARIFDELVWPSAERFNPDLMLVSAGYDGHWSDPLASMTLSLAGYASLAGALVNMADQLCDGRIAFALEGGYHLEALAYGVVNAFYALLGEDTVIDPLGPSPRQERTIDGLIDDLKDLHQLS